MTATDERSQKPLSDDEKSRIGKTVASMSEEQRVKLLRTLQPRMVPEYYMHTPHPKQQVFMSLKVREAMFGGSAGGGKSDALIMSALMYVDVPGYSALIIRRKWPDLNSPGAILDRTRQWLINTNATIREGGRKWIFPSGARITFGTLLNANDRYNYQCFTPNTDILTQRGWVKVAEVTEQDMVASVDPKTRTMTYEHVDRTYAYDFDGEMVDVYQQNGVSFTVTPNHKVFSGTERNRTLRPVDAIDLPRTATIPQVFDWEGAPNSGKEFRTRSRGGHVFTPDQWIDFLGWYISEGNSGSYNGRWEVKIAQTKPEGRKALLEAMEDVEGWHLSDHGISLNNRKLVEWLHEHTGVGALQKHLPESVWTWDQPEAERLLRALVAGDGTAHSESWSTYVTYSKRLADDVMRLAVHAGWRPTLDVIEGGHFTSGAQSYHVHLSKRTRDTGLDSAYKGSPHSQVDKHKPYKGKVYCVETHPHHTLVIRHRGRVSLSGNSAEYQFVGWDELTHFPREEDYEYLFSRIRRPQLVCLNCNVPVTRTAGASMWRHSTKAEYVARVAQCDGTYPDPQVLKQYPAAQDGTTIFDVPLRMRSATNPGGLGHEWVYNRFINPKTRKKGAVFIPSFLSDNPSLDRAAYVESLGELGEVEKERLLNGDWNITEQGDMFERHWFKSIREAPVAQRTVRSWDSAATAGGGDWTVGAKVSLVGGRWVIEDIVRGQWSSAQKQEVIRQVAASDGRGVHIVMEQEGGSAGKDVVDHYAREVLVGYTFHAEKPTGDKSTRALPLSSAAEAGNVYLVEGRWNATFLDEATQFPAGQHDDQVDAVAQGLNYIAERMGRGTRLLV